jgi:hypothetical protein
MTKDTVTQQVARWAEKAGATSERGRNYAERAGTAFEQFVELSRIFADGFNRNNQLKVEVSQECIGRLVAEYNRNLLNFKLEHGIPADERIDTHICAGLWFCSIVQEPVFGCDDTAAGDWDTATQEQLDAYCRLLSHFAFYFSFRVLRGHYKKYDELYLLNILKPIRKYMVDHCEAISSSPAASVGIFLTVSVFDKDCKAPAILS